MFEEWTDVELDLRVEATLALDAGHAPDPTLVAFDAAGPVAVVGLRPFEGDELMAALIEVLALLLPLGTDRIALGLPARARPGGAATSATGPTDRIDEGVVTSGAEAGEAASRSMLLLATAHVPDPASPRLAARLIPLTFDGDCWQWQDDEAVDIEADEWDVTRAIGVLLSSNDEQGPTRATDAQLHAQLGRCLLLGHTVALSPRVADLLQPSRLAGGH